MFTDFAGRLVIIRGHRSGVHVGTLVANDDRRAELRTGRRIWRWRGANTLHELALKGAAMESYTRISEAVESIVILDALEIIPVAPQARANLEVSRWLP